MTEEQLEILWKKQKGIDPKTGRAWLTPRMERNAKQLTEIWKKEEEKKHEN